MFVAAAAIIFVQIAQFDDEDFDGYGWVFSFFIAGTLIVIGLARNLQIQPLAKSPQPLQVYDMGENALLAWYVWFDSWLRLAGARLTTPMAYLPPYRIWGQMV